MNQHYIDHTDERLMNAIKEGDTQAFDELYRRYSTKLLHYFYRMLGKNEEKAQDFLQDLFLKIVEKPHLFNSNMRFSTWVFTVASNMCKNEYRRLKVRINGDRYVQDLNPTSEDIVLPNIDRQIDHAHFKKMLFEEVEKLDQTKKSTFLLRYQEHLSIKEISQVLDCSEGTVKSRLFYTTRKLAEKLRIFKPSKIGRS